MQRERILDEVRDVLARAGFFLSDTTEVRGLTFDIVARRDDSLLVLKVLRNVDALSRDNAGELTRIARTLGASPLLVGARSGSGSLEDGVVYSRFGVPILSPGSFRDLLLEGVPPFVFSAPGGLYVRIDGEALRRARAERRISLGALAGIAGVSRRAIQMYLEGMAATVEIALRLEAFLEEPLVIPMDPFVPAPDLVEAFPAWEDLAAFERDVFRRLSLLGYDILPTARAPFDAFTRDRRILFLTGVGAREGRIEQKAAIVASLGRVTERDTVLFLETRHVRENIGGTPVIGGEELRKVREREEIVDLIAERQA